MKTMTTDRPTSPGTLPRQAAALGAAMTLVLAAGLCAAQTPSASGGSIPASRPAAQATGRAEGSAADIRAVTRRLETLYPSTHFGPVQATAWPGVFEVALGANLSYVDESGRYFLFGQLYDMKLQRDLTSERKQAMRRIDFDSLPLSDALTEVRGKGTRTLVLFSDPDCPYCRRLEKELRTLDDITIHTFLMPMPTVHPSSRGKAVSIWCASDRLAAWQALMLRNTAPTAGDCTNPIDRNISLGERLGVNGTPTMFARDGRVLNGAASRDQIEAWLSAGDSSASASRTGGEAP